jgi:transposase
VTLQLWAEYIARHPDGCRFSRFCDLYRGWAASLPVTIRQNHAAGDKLFVDYPGDGSRRSADRQDKTGASLHGGAWRIEPVLCRGSLERAASGWIGCHVHAMEAFGGAPARHGMT